MLAACRGICTTVASLRALDPELVDLHVDAADVYTTADPRLRSEVAFRRALVFLASDLVGGRVVAQHPLYRWLHRHGAMPEDLAWFQANAIRDPAVIGLNLYPLFSGKVVSRPGGDLRIRMPYAPATIIDTLVSAYWRRYRRPLLISETATAGGWSRRARWLDDSLRAVRRCRARGVPLIGYTWWPLFALVTWAYRQGTRPPARYLSQMGLWDLADDLRRVRTPVAEAFRRAVQGGAPGPLAGGVG